jgi:alkylation response protein AidB-like acyl-CoA dehydrogenase
MNFDLNEQELALPEKIKTLISEGGLLVPEAIEEAPPKEVEAALRPCFKRLAETGYLSAAVGRANKSELLSLLAAQKELARSSQVLLFATELQRLVCSWIADHGGDAQHVAPITSGEQIAAVAVSESGAIKTEAVKAGDGYVLNGEKTQVSLAPIADVIAVCARTEEGLAIFLVPHASAGLEVGPRIRTLGYDALCTSPLRLNDVHVPAGSMIAPQDITGDLRAAEDRAAIAAALGILGLCLEEATQFANTPKEKGAKPPAGYQIVRFTLAEMLTLTQTSEILANRAFAAVAANDREADSLLLCAKVFAAESACTVSQQALQIMASAGYQRPNPVERAFRNARLGPIVGHTSEVARMSIADDILQ